MRETSSRNPTPTTRARLRNRVRRKVVTPELSRGLTFQIRLRSSCNSTKAPVANENEGNDAHYSPNKARADVAGAGDHGFDGLGSGLTHKAAKFRDDGALSRFSAKNKTCDCDGGQQHRGEREHGEEGDGRAQAHGAVGPPAIEGRLQKTPEFCEHPGPRCIWVGALGWRHHRSLLRYSPAAKHVVRHSGWHEPQLHRCGASRMGDSTAPHTPSHCSTTL